MRNRLLRVDGAEIRATFAGTLSFKFDLADLK
jgi:hypothetical protein